MMKKFNEFIYEDLRSKKIIAPKEFTIDNLKEAYPDLNITVADFNIVIECDRTITLDKEFYYALKKDHINKGDIVFENCKKISLWADAGFTSIKEYGVFGENIKDFYCYGCESLTSLDGAPKTIGGDFYCNGCKNLTSLEFAPKEVGGDFYCSGCKKLTNLEGAPEIVNRFYCYSCNPKFIKLAKEKYDNKVRA